MTAEVREVFKGNLKKGEIVRFREDLLYRPFREEDLVEQVVFLTIPTDNRYKRMKYDKDGKSYFELVELKEKGVIYVNEEYREGFIKHGILEKLRKIAKDQ